MEAYTSFHDLALETLNIIFLTRLLLVCIYSSLITYYFFKFAVLIFLAKTLSEVIVSYHLVNCLAKPTSVYNFV
jgi:hypothetical protein